MTEQVGFLLLYYGAFAVGGAVAGLGIGALLQTLDLLSRG